MFSRAAIRRSGFGIIVISLAVAGAVWVDIALFLPLFRDPVDFSRDIRPIFNQKLHCHHGGSPPKTASFIFREEALGRVVWPSDHCAWQPRRIGTDYRVTSRTRTSACPITPPLAPERIALLRRWIKEPKWMDHWAFVPPKQATVYRQ